jgi:hypothetical protein
MTRPRTAGASKNVAKAASYTVPPPGFGERAAAGEHRRAVTRERIAQWQAEAEALVRRCVPDADPIAVISAAGKIVGHLRAIWGSQRTERP